MSENQTECHQPEEGLEIPLERINPDLLQQMIEEFVTREWADLADDGFTLEDKVAQVLAQLRNHSAKVMYDLATESWNIVEAKKQPASG